jgi:prevent-host-death family protein
MQVGVRELKQRLSEFVELARSGQTVEITDRGVPKALLVPLPVGDPLAAGIEEGWLRPGRGSGLRAHVGRPSAQRMLDVLDDDRGTVDE